MNVAKLLCGFVVLVALAGCAGNPPYHSPPQSDANPAVPCSTEYQAIDNAVMQDVPSDVKCIFPVDKDGTKTAECLEGILENEHDDPGKSCWTTSWEQHAQYDLFFTEFDDEGWAADVRHQMDRSPANRVSPSWVSEQDVLFRQLDRLVSPGEGGASTPLDIVIYTHGWHGSAEPNNSYVLLFRAFLQKLAIIDANSPARRHVVGIFVGWRGDSLLLPPHKIWSVWDRKQAAETVSVGDVHGLFSRLNNFYIANSCRVIMEESPGAAEAPDVSPVPIGGRPPSLSRPAAPFSIDCAGSFKPPARGAYSTLVGDPHRCGSVRMLTVGHSFGALVNFRSLLGPLEVGMSTPDNSRVYSFGDLVVLLNPAFEGVRYEPLFSDAVRRHTYLDGSQDPDGGGAQLPVLVTLQSQGDVATGYAFPAFRAVSSGFEHAVGPAENDERLHAVGWVDAFATHKLCLNTKAADSVKGAETPGALCVDASYAPEDGCDSQGSLDDQIKCRVGSHWRAAGPEGRRPFRYDEFGKNTSVYMGNGMSLITLRDTQGIQTSAYFPYWVIKVDKSVMADHDDVWNENTTEVILQLYRTIVDQRDTQDAAIQEACKK